VESVDPIWEIVNKVASPNGVTNYVISFQQTTYKKGGKEVKVIVNVVNGMKDGKIVEEWDIYDTKPMMDLISQK
jgi:predicted ester cyclase